MYLLCLCSHVVTNLVLMGTNQNACSNYSNACSNYSYVLKQSYFHEKRKKKLDWKAGFFICLHIIYVCLCAVTELSCCDQNCMTCKA